MVRRGVDAGGGRGERDNKPSTGELPRKFHNKITKYTTTGYEKLHNQVLKSTSQGELVPQIQSKFTTKSQKPQPNIQMSLKILLNLFLGEAIPRPRSQGARRESFEGGLSFFWCFCFERKVFQSGGLQELCYLHFILIVIVAGGELWQLVPETCL